MKQEEETRRLIDRLMSGDITPAEQQQLKALLSAPDLTPELAIYRDMMEWMDRPLPTPTTEMLPTPTAEMLPTPTTEVLPTATAEELQVMSEVGMPLRPVRRWAVAASIAVIFCLGMAAATIYHFAPAATEEVTEVTSNEVATTEAPDAKPDAFVFDNVEMEQVAATLGRHYKVAPVFESEEARHVRLYFQVEKERSIEEVVALLNHFSKLSVTLRDGQLIIR